MEKRKVTVIGGGPGGYVAAIRAAQLGAEVMLIEKEKLGGTCLNVGCIPMKSLLHAAELFDGARNGSEFGILAEPSVDYRKVQKRKEMVVNQLVGGVKGLLTANGVKVIYGTTSFESRDTLRVEKSGGETLLIKADKVIIASGSRPVIPPIPGADSKQCIDSTGALELKEIPKSMLIIGGGVIGVEIATVFSVFGCDVTIVEMLPEILPMMDPGAAVVVKKRLIKKNVKIFTNTKIKSITDAGKSAKVKAAGENNEEVEFECEKVLICVGRRANTEELCLSKAGVKAEKGIVPVDPSMQTNVEGIYAVGDCTGGIMLAHVASVQGEIAAENAMGHTVIFSAGAIPSCVYTVPEIASVGLTEKQAKEQGIEYVVGEFPLTANGKAVIMGGGDGGFVKIVAGKEFKEILGVTIAGPRATDMICSCAVSIKLEATAEELINTVFAHPTVSEAIREAALAVENRAIHINNK